MKYFSLSSWPVWLMSGYRYLPSLQCNFILFILFFNLWSTFPTPRFSVGFGEAGNFVLSKAISLHDLKLAAHVLVLHCVADWDAEEVYMECSQWGGPVWRWAVSWSCSPESDRKTTLPAPYWRGSGVQVGEKPSCKPTVCCLTKSNEALFSSVKPSKTNLVLLRWLQ